MKRKRRTRSTDQDYIGWYHDNPQGASIGRVPERTLEDDRVSPCDCSHTIGPVYSATWKTTFGYRTYIGSRGYHVDPKATAYLYQHLLGSFNPSKLGTSSGFNPLTFFAELDDTVAMFGKKMISSISYGGIKWGWMPFISDVQKVVDLTNQLKKVSTHGTNYSQKYTDSRTFTVVTPIPILVAGGSVVHKYTVTEKLDGEVTWENNILSNYDMAGFHPSPKVLWDLVPLSFAVDYVLPVGDILDRISPSQGWVKSANFSGWQMVTIKCEEKQVTPFGSYGWLEVQPPHTNTTFTRNLVSGLAIHQKTIRKDIGLKWPSFSNLLDYAYLAKMFSRR